MAIGVPGCPELAACTASMERVRMVLTQSWSSGSGVPMRTYCLLNGRELERGVLFSGNIQDKGVVKAAITLNPRSVSEKRVRMMAPRDPCNLPEDGKMTRSISASLLAT